MSYEFLRAYASRAFVLGSLLLTPLCFAQEPSATSGEAHDMAPDTAAPLALEGDEKHAAIEAYQNCLRSTGSRIVRAGSKRCSDLPGSVYSREDLDRTGQTDVGHALEQLDPRIRVR